jgi:hypothetical protein
MIKYQQQRATSYYVVPESEISIAYLCVGGQLPDLMACADDIYVWPEGLSWTMAFTHELDWGLGPYFCLREWIV